MPDQAMLNHAAGVLAAISSDQRADTALRFYFEEHRYLQPPAKRVISHTVFVYFRWLSWLDAKASPQKRLEQAVALHERFTADPKSIKPEALAVRAVPAWLWGELSFPATAGDSAKADYLRQIQRDPALWIRARPGQGPALAKSLFACEPTPRSADALRFTGLQDLFKTEQFRTGEFEIQDLASQLVGLAAAPKPGETWWDACAGEGGKTLHLADLMQNKGVVWATDRNARRLDTLKRRAARAKLFNYRTDFWDGGSRLPTKTKFDGILVDAPCSGVGTWQRNPHARWTTTPDDVRELAGMQRVLLTNVCSSLKPGGRLVYAVCTLTRSETTAVVEAFTAAHPEFEPVPVDFGGSKTEDRARNAKDHSDSDKAAAPSSALRPPSSVFLWPQDLNANGMFIAAWKRKS